MTDFREKNEGSDVDFWARTPHTGAEEVVENFGSEQVEVSEVISLSTYSDYADGIGAGESLAVSVEIILDEANEASETVSISVNNDYVDGVSGSEVGVLGVVLEDASEAAEEVSLSVTSNLTDSATSGESLVFGTVGADEVGAAETLAMSVVDEIDEAVEGAEEIVLSVQAGYSDGSTASESFLLQTIVVVDEIAEASESLVLSVKDEVDEIVATGEESKIGGIYTDTLNTGESFTLGTEIILDESVSSGVSATIVVGYGFGGYGHGGYGGIENVTG